MTSPETITVQHLRKAYTIYEREGGLFAAMRGLARRKIRKVVAVDDLSLSIAPGEIVGFLGPNGAGKTTTLKMLSGLLHPTSGTVQVLGYQPWKREKAYLGQIAMIMGQRNQLIWDIPPLDSFELNRAIYQIPLADYRRSLQELTELLDLGSLLQKPVRTLSLGERMKCEIAASLLHQPRVLFLDEPTIGLDVVMQHRLRDFLLAYNRRLGANIILTSHYMADVEALCKRVVVIHHGRVLFDGDLDKLVNRFSPRKRIVVTVDQIENLHMEKYGQVVDEQEEGRIVLHVLKSDVASVTSRLFTDLPISDVNIEDFPIELIVKQIFDGGDA